LDWTEFTTRLAAELRRLGISDRDARFLGFDVPEAALFDHLAQLPDGAGAAKFYAHLGSDFNELQREEAAWLRSPPPDA
jgi:hypothetical protein